jgi:hypothetical protein
MADGKEEAVFKPIERQGKLAISDGWAFLCFLSAKRATDRYMS